MTDIRLGGDLQCQTCGDVATRMRVLAVEEGERLALCLDEGERRRTVDIGIVGAVLPGDTLLVHAGTALIRERR
jgi:hydrogenase maturation factor